MVGLSGGPLVRWSTGLMVGLSAGPLVRWSAGRWAAAYVTACMPRHQSSLSERRGAAQGCHRHRRRRSGAMTDLNIGLSWERRWEGRGGEGRGGE